MYPLRNWTPLEAKRPIQLWRSTLTQVVSADTVQAVIAATLSNFAMHFADNGRFYFADVLDS